MTNFLFIFLQCKIWTEALWQITHHLNWLSRVCARICMRDRTVLLLLSCTMLNIQSALSRL